MAIGGNSGSEALGRKEPKGDVRVDFRDGCESVEKGQRHAPDRTRSGPGRRRGTQAGKARAPVRCLGPGLIPCCLRGHFPGGGRPSVISPRLPLSQVRLQPAPGPLSDHGRRDLSSYPVSHTCNGEDESRQISAL